MTPLRRVGTAALLMALLAFNLACPGPAPEPPDLETCEGAPADATITGLSGTAELLYGAQGSPMVMVEPSWTGAGAPECALVTGRLIDASGAELGVQTVALGTEATSDGRRALSGFFFIVDGILCGARVELASYGRTATLDVTSYACETDGGPGEDGGP